MEHLRAHVLELTEPSWTRVSTRERCWVDPQQWHDGSRTVRHDALLVQLLDPRRASDQDTGGTGKGPSSRVIARAQVLDTERAIRDGVRRQALAAGAPLDVALALVPGLRFLAKRAPQLSTQQLDSLEAEVRSWRTRARQALGYEDTPQVPRVRCMVCGQSGTVRFTAEPQRAWCVYVAPDGEPCGAEWDAATIGVFAEWCRQQESRADSPGPTEGGQDDQGIGSAAEG